MITIEDVRDVLEDEMYQLELYDRDEWIELVVAKLHLINLRKRMTE